MLRPLDEGTVTMGKETEPPRRDTCLAGLAAMPRSLHRRAMLQPAIHAMRRWRATRRCKNLPALHDVTKWRATDVWRQARKNFAALNFTKTSRP